MKSSKNIWRTDIEDWTILTKDMVNFYLNQAESELKSSLDLHDKITARAFTILTILIPVITLTITYIIRQLSAEFVDKYLLLVCVASLFVVVLCMLFLINLVFPRNWMSLGRPPKDIFISKMVDNEYNYTDEQKYVGIVMREIENIQYKIDYNDDISKSRLFYLKTVIIVISITFFIISLLLVKQLLFFFIY